MNTLRDAEAAISQRFAAEAFRGELRYDPTKVIENDRWWFIPCGWIGCFGCIVNKSDLYVDWLGSGTFTLDDCFWGHDHGLFNDLVDFEFSPDTNLEAAREIVSSFLHMHPNARGVHPSYPIPYRDSEIATALSDQFPLFRRHNVWQAIPKIRRAFEDYALRFVARLSTGA